MTEESSISVDLAGAGTGEKLGWLAWVGFGGMWLLLVNQLWLEWSTNPDYSYGFVVPLLALYLFALRWQSWQPPACPAPTPRSLWFSIGFLAFCLFPVRLLQVAQPEWRFVSWATAGIVIGITLGLFWHRGGMAWARHIAFPVAFVFTAVPWPTLIEVPFTQFLMRADTAFGVLLFNFSGIPALQRGNLIQVGREIVGISEACSGIRSLQVTWMSALFLGELYRFTVVRRFLLVGCGIAIALLCNLGRTCLLAWLSFSQGNEVMEKWHDAIGLAVLALSLGSLWVLSAAVNSSGTGEKAAQQIIAAKKCASRPWPRGLMPALVGWLVLVIAGAEAWFRSHEIARPAAQHWSATWPVSAPGFHEIEIPPRTRSMLKYTEGRNAAWRREDGGTWTVFYFRWAPGRTSAALARGHRPEICLPSVGCLLQREEGVETFEANGVSLPFRHLLFNQGGYPLHVWWCLWDEVCQGKESDEKASEYQKIIRAVLRGQRNLGQQVLEVALGGVEDSQAAHAEMAQMLPRLIQKQGQTAVETSSVR
ncbi:MAG: exosortase/archaeosortase family protein [Verrucomicrobia bacterium]|nr:exosortase/archaeosortase family protein [Verrucomicrobiota bacterium]